MERLPVVVLSGFLGSGKTTMLNRWLSERQDLAVIINELGDIGIDQHLTGPGRVPVTLLSGGCLCCVIQGSLSSTLRNLFMARKNGELPAFSTLLLETTGAADPFGVTAPLEQDPWLKKRFFCQSVLTVVDAVAGVRSLERHPEWLEQIHAADALLLSKTEQCQPQDLAALKVQLAALNPTARIYPEPAPVDLLAQSFPRRCRVTGSFAPAPSSSSLLSPQRPVPPPSRHQLYSASLRWDGVLSWPLWQAALKQLAEQCGDALIRVKGLLRVEGLDGPLLVQWVEGQEPELAPLNQWPDQDSQTRLVLIVRHPQADFAQQQLAHWETLLTQLAPE
ncbi:GTP-binding protein [Alcanivorax jadensis]|uniref:CobW family GTP-binding protein n=1 Tax=Alcanivorax jadensis TaxID=64988 RepID=UPI0026EDE383|nr:GTP-binding protein [Alcanivorax jadensis]